MVDLMNPKWEDFQISDMPKRERSPLTPEKIAHNLKIQRVHKMARAISRSRQGGEQAPTKPKGKLIRNEDIPKELFDRFFGNQEGISTQLT